jgi:RNA polymerase sigma factor
MNLLYWAVRYVMGKKCKLGINRNTENLADVISEIKDGNDDLREQIINQYKPFVIKCVSEFLNKFIEVENSEEFSIGLIGFNDAIDSFDLNKNSSFLNFAELVIKRKLINYIKSQKKTRNTYPFSFFEGENSYPLKNAIIEEATVLHFDRFETQEEIKIFNTKLKKFGITLEELVKKTPKHNDSKQMLIKIAEIITKNDELYDKLNNKMYIPMTELIPYITVNPKTVERNRKYIIAACIAMRSDLEIIKGFLDMHAEGR